jgi:predicted O-linked N-acetylglucosamine transferase (SPINDLY family)
VADAQLNKLLQRAVEAHQKGDLEHAERLYRQVLQRNPEDPDALHLLGGIAHLQGNLQLAQQHIQKALELRPRDPLFHANFAAVCIAQKRSGEALEHARQAVALDSKCVEGWRALGTAQALLKCWREAESAYERAIEQAPRHSETHNNMGNVQKTLGRPDRAEQHYRKAIALNSGDADALNNLGALLLGQKRYQQSQQYLMLAVERDPESTIAWNNLGQALQAQGKTKEADIAYGKALALEPDQLLWRYRRMLNCPLIPESRKRIEYWRKGLLKQLRNLPKASVRQWLDQLTTSHTEAPYHLAYQGLDNYELKRAYAEQWIEIPQIVAPKPRESTGKPRIGVLVTAGHEGIFDACSRGLFSCWDFESAQLVLCAPAKLAQAWSKALPQLEILELVTNLGGCAQQLKAAHLDVLYYWEVGSDALNYFLARMRVAPVQVTSWGTPETTALPEMDYYLSCQAWREGCEAEQYSEKLIVLKDIPMVYYKPSNLEPAKQSSLKRRAEQHIYLCVQNLYKLHPDFDQLILGILEADPWALIYLVEGREKSWTELLQQRFQKVLKQQAERVKFLSRMGYSEYLAILHEADCLLDSPHFSGGNTSFEALSQGLPIVTLAGTLARSRFTTACYRQMEWMDLVAYSDEAYVAKAVKLASDPAWREEARAQITQRQDRVLDRQDIGQAFQQALLDCIL